MHSTLKTLRQTIKYNLQRNVSVTCVRKKNEYILKSSFSDVVLPDVPLTERLWRDLASFKNLIALECAETGKKYTYTQLRDYSGNFATSLHRKLGLKAGDVVAVVIPNRPEFPVVAFGALHAGCAVTALNPIYKEYEISHQVSLTKPKLIVTVPECYNEVKKGLASAKITPKIIVVDNPSQEIPEGSIRYTDIVENGEADFGFLEKIILKNDELAFIPFSSGTTGLPKGVEITIKNVLAGLEIMHYEANCFPILASAIHQDVVPCVLPFFHIYGLVVTLIGHLTKGCKLVTMPKFSASLYFDILKNHQASLLYVVPPIVLLLGKHPDVGWEHLRHIRHVTCGAAPMSSSDVEPLLEKARGQMAIGQGYGATETTSLTTTTPKGYKTLDYSAAGVPMSTIELMFCDPATGKPVPIGEQGELLIRGPIVMKGYHKNEQATKESMTEDGFYKTGDLGCYKDGVGLYINDRIKELIKVKGMQVAPAELESLLRTHPAVAEAAVIGVPHEIFGETPKAFVISKPGTSPSAAEIQQYVADKVAKYKMIDEVQFQGELLIRGPIVMKGYHKNEQATKESMTEDGFYKTGDLGCYKDGVGLYINDRIKELIKVKGMQVAPAELESLLRTHPAVAEAAVIGVPHEIFGETPKAFVISKPGTSPSAAEIQQYVADKVAKYKMIDEVQFVSEIPKTSSGKIMRRELKKMYA